MLLSRLQHLARLVQQNHETAERLHRASLIDGRVEISGVVIQEAVNASVGVGEGVQVVNRDDVGRGVDVVVGRFYG